MTFPRIIIYCIASVVVKGIGKFTRKLPVQYFAIEEQELVAGTDYNAKLVYSYAQDVTLGNGLTKDKNDLIPETDIVPIGTLIRVTAKEKAGSNYVGETSITYSIVKTSLNDAIVSIYDQYYTGEGLKITKEDIKSIKI